MTEQDTRHTQLAVIIADNASPDERIALRVWASKLLDIRHGNLSALQKAKAGIATTIASKVIWPTLKIVARKTKDIGWDSRSRTARLGIGGVAAGIALFGGQSAGIAALGTAIGVPLWVVLGAGASFANVLIEEVTRRSPHGSTTASYTTIDAERIDP